VVHKQTRRDRVAKRSGSGGVKSPLRGALLKRIFFLPRNRGQQTAGRVRARRKPPRVTGGRWKYYVNNNKARFISFRIISCLGSGGRGVMYTRYGDKTVAVLGQSAFIVDIPRKTLTFFTWSNHPRHCRRHGSLTFIFNILIRAAVCKNGFENSGNSNAKSSYRVYAKYIGIVQDRGKKVKKSYKINISRS
jgi:hypothetical protein